MSGPVALGVLLSYGASVLAADRVLLARLVLGGIVVLAGLCAALAVATPPRALRRCRCRSYWSRTGVHADGCPRRRP